MAIDFGTGLSGAATSALTARTPFVRKSDSPSRVQESGRSRVDQNSSGPRVGFGEGTISAVGVAATTVDRNLESARKIVPTLDELSTEARARSEAIRDQAANAEQVRVERGGQDARRNESAARAQVQGFEQRAVSEDSPSPDRFTREHAQPPAFTTSVRSVESVVSFVTPEPATSFDVFG